MKGKNHRENNVLMRNCTLGLPVVTVIWFHNDAHVKDLFFFPLSCHESRLQNKMKWNLPSWKNRDASGTLGISKKQHFTCHCLVSNELFKREHVSWCESIFEIVAGASWAVPLTHWEQSFPACLSCNVLLGRVDECWKSCLKLFHCVQWFLIHDVMKGHFRQLHVH